MSSQTISHPFTPASEEVKLKRFSLPVLGVPIPHIKGIARKSEGDLTKTWRGPLTIEEFI